MSALKSSIVLITGAGRGLGRSHALTMAERGADVIVQDSNAETVEETAALVRKRGRRAHVIACDIADIAPAHAAIARAETELGRIDVLVNNAGISGQHVTIEEIDEARFDRMMAVHVAGGFFAAQAVVPGMKRRRRGSIVNTASAWGMTGWPVSSHYCAAKAALLGLTKAWAKELAPYNIRVNAIAPGWIDTGKHPAEKVKVWAEAVPLRRFGTPAEVSALVAFLASDEAAFITGQVVSPNGGETVVGF
ncbi:MAG: SDR family NAD(P)-dependent oxidoreductase [Alphaproteobacteria bacterium]